MKIPDFKYIFKDVQTSNSTLPIINKEDIDLVHSYILENKGNKHLVYPAWGRILESIKQRSQNNPDNKSSSSTVSD